MSNPARIVYDKEWITGYKKAVGFAAYHYTKLPELEKEVAESVAAYEAELVEYEAQYDAEMAQEDKRDKEAAEARESEEKILLGRLFSGLSTEETRHLIEFAALLSGKLQRMNRRIVELEELTAEY